MFKHFVGKSICYGHVDFVHFDLLGAKEIHLPLKKMPEKYKNSFGEFLDAKIYQGFVQRQNGSWRRVYVLLKINPQDIIEDVFVDEQGLCEHLLVAQKEEVIKKCDPEKYRLFHKIGNDHNWIIDSILSAKNRLWCIAQDCWVDSILVKTIHQEGQLVTVRYIDLLKSSKYVEEFTLKIEE